MRALAIVPAAFLLTLMASGGFVVRQATQSLPKPERAAVGVSIAGRPVPDDAPPARFVDELQTELLDRPLVLRWQGQEFERTTARALGAVVDGAFATRQALSVAREGDFETRVLRAREVLANGVDIPLPISLPVERLAAHLSELKERADERPVAARRHLNGRTPTTSRVTPHVEGRSIDAYRTADAVLRAIREQLPEAEIVSRPELPAATTEAAEKADVSQKIAGFETRFGGPPGRDKNIVRAALLLDGQIVMPGQTLSFNEVVGPRSEQNGFFPAPEIYKGEMRAGIGGGACQVASTLYAAAFFGGLGVSERQNHSRPSGYIRPGLDATVSFPVLDLRIENPFEFPIVIRSAVEPGTISFELYGRERKLEVQLSTETVGILKIRRKLERTSMLGEGEFRLKQKGRRGLVIKRIKTVTDQGTGQRQEEETRDTYPAQTEIYLVGPKIDPETLPPLPDAVVVEGGA